MDPTVDPSRPHRFTIGLVAGTLLGAGLALWLGPGVAAGLRRGTRRWARQLDRIAGTTPCLDVDHTPRGRPQAL
jgi:hypothetical protein